MIHVKKMAFILGLFFTFDLPAYAGSQAALEIASVNCYAFPKFLTQFLKIFGTDLHEKVKQPTDVRLAEIGGYLLHNNKLDPDIVAFQELWQKSNKKKMKKAIKEKYPHIYYKTRKAVFYKIDSGLMLASKLPAERVQYLTFKSKGAGSDGMALKGAIIAEFRSDSGELFTVVNTHLQSGSKPKASKARSNQIEEIAKFLDSKWFYGQSKRRFILMGDLNSQAMIQNAAGQMINGLKYVEAILLQNNLRVDSDAYIKKHYQKDMHSNWEKDALIDHVLVSDELLLDSLRIDHNVQGEDSNGDYNPKTALTDHALIHSRIYF